MLFVSLSLHQRKSAPSTVAPVAVGAPEPPIQAFAVPGNASVDVSWHSSLWGSPTSYEVHRGTSSGFTPSGGTLLHTETGSTRTYTDSTAVNNTTYYYKVLAVNANGSSDATTATAYPDITTAITPSVNLSGPSLPGIVQWWELNETSDGVGRNDRSGALPTMFPREWTLDWIDVSLFGTFVSSSVVGGRTVAHFDGGSRLGFAAPSINNHVSYNSWTIVARVYRTVDVFGTVYIHGAGSPGFANDKPSVNLQTQSSGKYKLISYPLFADVADSLESTLVTTSGAWYTVAASYNMTSDRLEIAVVDAAGTVTRTLGSGGIGPRQVSQWVQSITFAGQVIEGYMGPMAFFREVLTDTQLQWFNGHGSGQTFDVGRFAPMDDPGPAPFSHLKKHVTGMITHVESRTWNPTAGGFFWFMPFPLYLWDAGLAATRGRYVWIYSSDHAHNDGVSIGYSDDPGVKPTVWTKALPGTITIPPTGRNSQFDGPESPFLVYRPDDPNGRKFYLYAHFEMLNNYPPNVTADTLQETLLYSSADLVTWVYECEAIPCTDAPNFGADYAHTGYAIVYNPGTLPGVDPSLWTCYHRADTNDDLFFCTTSTDPKLFTPGSTPQPLHRDTGCNDGDLGLTQHGKLIVVGSNVYNISYGRSANGRGVYCTQMQFDHNQWRRFQTGKRWTFGELNPYDFPTLGFCQDMTSYYESGIVHHYRMWGFLDWIGEERIDYYTAIFDEAAANSSRPIGTVVENNGLNTIKVTVMDALPHRSYRVYRKTTGAYALLGLMSDTLDANGRVPYTDSTAVDGTSYTYQVRTYFNSTETNGTEVTIKTIKFDDTILGPIDWRALYRLDTSKTIFNVVTGYGAGGAGITDDTGAIRNAIAAAISNGGGIVYFPTGTYAVAPQLGDSTQLGPYSTTINASTDVLTAAGNALLAGMSVYFVNTGTLPQVASVNVATGVGHWYFVGTISGSTFKLYPTFADSVAQTNAINFSSAGSGVQITFPPYDVIFPVLGSNITFLGDGPTLSIIKAYTTGLINPQTNWIVTGDPYFQIGRCGLFYVNTTAANRSNIQFRSLKMDGQCSYTGDNGVGGNPPDGDGWDLSHKCIALNGSHYANNILVFNCDMCNWRGEIIYGGGNVATLGTLFVVQCTIRGSNADGISTSTSTLCVNTTIGGANAGDDVYNGFENAIGDTQMVVIDGCTIRCGSSTAHGNGIAAVGTQYSTWLVYRTNIVNCQHGVLFSFECHNFSLDRVNFINCAVCTITSILDSGGSGFSAFNFNNVTVDATSGALLLCQGNIIGPSTGFGYKPLQFYNITLNGGSLLEGTFAGTLTNWAPAGRNVSYDRIHIATGATDVTAGAHGGIAGIWTNVTRDVATTSCGVKVDEFTAATTTNFSPYTDRVWANSNGHSPTHQLLVIDPAELTNYPAGFKTTVFSPSATNWYLKADATWNTWAADINVTSAGITIRFNGTVFDRIG